MIIKQCRGYELEKSKKNTSEDFFNQSEVTFVEQDEERMFQVLYLRYFDELMDKFTPFEQDPIFEAADREVTFKDIVAIACLLKNPEFKKRKRVYINTEKEFSALFQGLDFEKLTKLMRDVEENQGAEVQSPLEYMIQTV